MRIPIGVVEIILRMVEEKQLAEYNERLTEHKKKFPNSFSIFENIGEVYRNHYETENIHEVVIVRDCEIDVVEGWRTIDASISFIQFYKSWFDNSFL